MNDFISTLQLEKRVVWSKIEAIKVFLNEPFVEVSMENLALLEQKLEALKVYHDVISKQLNLNIPKMPVPNN